MFKRICVSNGVGLMKMCKKLDASALVWPCGLHRDPKEYSIVSLSTEGVTILGGACFPRRQNLLLRIKLPLRPTRKVNAVVVNRFNINSESQLIRVRFREMDEETRELILKHVEAKSKEVEKHGAILILDDSIQICRVLEAQIASMGKEVFSSTDCDEALKRLGACNVHLAIVDLVLGDQQSGINILKTLAHFFPDVTRVLMSGYVNPKSIQERYKSGLVQESLAKPWEFEDVHQLLMEKSAA